MGSPAASWEYHVQSGQRLIPTASIPSQYDAAFIRSAFNAGSAGRGPFAAGPSCNRTNAPSIRRCAMEGADLRAYQPPLALS